MKQSELEYLIALARSIAQDAMELHVLSFRMGCATEKPEDYPACQEILARASSFLTEVDRQRREDAIMELAKP